MSSGLWSQEEMMLIFMRTVTEIAETLGNGPLEYRVHRIIIGDIISGFMIHDKPD